MACEAHMCEASTLSRGWYALCAMRAGGYGFGAPRLLSCATSLRVLRLLVCVRYLGEPSIPKQVLRSGGLVDGGPAQA
jgi:hypothetical protein